MPRLLWLPRPSLALAKQRLVGHIELDLNFETEIVLEEWLAQLLN
jgi:hypothetical protein